MTQRGKRQALYNLVHPVRAQREFPVEGHRVGVEGVHDIDHVLPLGVIAGIAAMPCVAAIQQQCIGAVGTDRIDHGSNPIQSPHTAIAFGQRRKIIISQGIGRGAAVLDAVSAPKIGAGDMRHRAFVVTNTDVDLRLAKIQRFELRMDVRDMDQRDIPVSVKLQQLVLCQGLLRSKLRPIAKTGPTIKRRSGHGGLQEITARNHRVAPVTRTYAHL